MASVVASGEPKGALEGAPAEPLVSIVIPTYNRAHLVGRAIASALAQTYRSIEIIVVDDGSTDALETVLTGFDEPRLRRAAHPTNLGAAAARNTGVAASKGEYVAFLDSDDYWLPQKLERQVAAMRGQTDAVAGHVCAYEYTKPGRRPRHIAPTWTPRSFRRNQLFGCTCGPGTTLLCRRAVFTEVGPFDQELRRLEDWDWMLRLAAEGYRLLGSAEVLARVETSSPPAAADVRSALARIRSRHHSAIARDGIRSRRIFESSVWIEHAAVAFRAGAYTRAVGWGLRSLAWYPGRAGVFFRRLMPDFPIGTRLGRAAGR